MWTIFKDWIFDIIQFFFNFCGDWGLAIIIVTVIFRVLLAPLMHTQTKSTYQMSKIQPEIEKIQKKFEGDQVRINEETQKLYAEAKFNPLAGCLPMLLQMPIFIALFQVLREMASRSEVTGYTFYQIIPDLVISPSEAWAQGFAAFIPYFVVLIIFAGATFLPMVLQQVGNNSKQAKQTLLMGIVMSVFMLWIGWGSPAGVLLFWGTSSLIGIAQQQITQRMLKKKEEREAEEIVLKPIEVDVTRKVKKPRPKKKSR